MYQVIKINHTLNIHVHEGSQANPYEPIRGHVALCDLHGGTVLMHASILQRSQIHGA